jgi:hypothetical protein
MDVRAHKWWRPERAGRLNQAVFRQIFLSRATAQKGCSPRLTCWLLTSSALGKPKIKQMLAGKTGDSLGPLCIHHCNEQDAVGPDWHPQLGRHN